MRREPGPGPEVRQSAPVANLHEFGGVGRLHAVRLWLDQHSEDGTKVRMSSAFLGHVRACPGLADARRAVVRLSPDAGSEDMQQAALAEPKVQAAIAGKQVVKIVVVPGKLINIVVK